MSFGWQVVSFGDTFNCWFENQNGYAGDYHEIIDIFAEAVSSGIEIQLIAGNRDFVFANGVVTPSGYVHSAFQMFFNNSLSALSRAGILLAGIMLNSSVMGKHFSFLMEIFFAQKISGINYCVFC